MTLFIPMLLKASFSKPRFPLYTLHKCLDNYSYDMQMVHRHLKHEDNAYVFINSWKENKDTLLLLDTLHEYDKANVYHNQKDFWTFKPIFQFQTPIFRPSQNIQLDLHIH